MQRGISLNTYRLFDIGIFVLLAGVFEYLGVVALRMYDFPSFSISLFLALVLICMMRWGYFSLIIPIVSGVIYCLANDGNLSNYVIYIIGNSFVMFNLLWFIKGKNKITDKLYLTIFYVVSGYLLICLGRSIVSLFFENQFFPVLLGFLGTETLNLAITIIIIVIARRQKGLFTDQIEYIKEVQKEE